MMESRTKMGQGRSAVQDDFYVFPVGSVYYVKFRDPRTKAAAEAGAFALVEYLKKKIDDGTAQRVRAEDITVGVWIEKFTAIETSPRTGRNAAKNVPTPRKHWIPIKPMKDRI